MNKKVLAFFTVVIAIGCIYYWNLERPVSIPLLSDEAQAYNISSSENYPKFTKAIIDPLDVVPGDTQFMIIELEDPSGISWVKAEIEHDIGTDEINLKLTEEGSYLGEWRVHSTHSETYHTTFTAQNKNGEKNSITLAWTDACVPSPGGDWTLDGNCAISGVNGVDNGNFTVDGGYTLTVQYGATFAWNDGKSITITNGSIAINAGGELKKTNLWMIDADSDDYVENSTQHAQDSAPTNAIGQPIGGRRRNVLVSITAIDCNDSNALIQNCATCNLCENEACVVVENGTECGTDKDCISGVCETCITQVSCFIGCACNVIADNAISCDDHCGTIPGYGGLSRAWVEQVPCGPTDICYAFYSHSPCSSQYDGEGKSSWSRTYYCACYE